MSRFFVVELLFKMPLAVASSANILQISATGKFSTPYTYNIVSTTLYVKIRHRKSISYRIVLRGHVDVLLSRLVARMTHHRL